MLQGLVDLADVAKICSAFERDGPVLDETEDLVLDIMVQARHLEDGDEVVYKFSGRNFNKERVSAVLDAGICKLDRQMSARTGPDVAHTYTQSEQLHVRIFVVQPSLESTHCILGSDRLGADLVRDFEVECNVLRA